MSNDAYLLELADEERDRLRAAVAKALGLLRPYGHEGEAIGVLQEAMGSAYEPPNNENKDE